MSFPRTALGSLLALWMTFFMLDARVKLVGFSSKGSGGYPTGRSQDFSDCTTPPKVAPTLPTDMALPRQQDANCFAWQEFIALNWVAQSNACGVPDPDVKPTQFGVANDRRPVVWETYMEVSGLFRPKAAPPQPWCSPQALPDFLLPKKAELRRTSEFGYKALFLESKFAGNRPLKLGSVVQAGTKDAWLTAQNKKQTLYEIRLNEDEYKYISANKLYDAAIQQEFVRTKGIDLPDGTMPSWIYGKTGAIEIKAAWIELEDANLWPSFKTSDAIVVYPNKPDPPRRAVVGLVGLHIIHKTALGQQFIWATFEHVDNCPSIKEVQQKKLKTAYTYFNPACQPASDHYRCEYNHVPKPGVDPTDAPMQVVRMNPLNDTPANDIVGLNRAVWDLIRAANNKSVFLNYQLVNVLWANHNEKIKPGTRVPLTAGDPQPSPSVEKVANSTIETYSQDKTCLYCHVSAPIASVRPRQFLQIFDGGTSARDEERPYAADYSFVFSRAQTHD